MLSAMVGRQLGLVSVIIPFWLVAAQVGWRGMIGVWPACLVTGITFGLSQFFVSNFHGPWLVGIASASVSMISLVGFLKVWRPAEEQTSSTQTVVAEQPKAGPQAAAWKAWLPWIFLTVCVFLSGLPTVKNYLNNAFAPNLHVPLLDDAVLRVPPVVANPTPEHAVFSFNALSATGTALLIAGILAGLCLQLDAKQLMQIYGRTIWRVRVSLLTISLMLALGYTTRFSGTDSTMGLAMAATRFL